MLGQIRTVSELQPFTFDTFDLGHPVKHFLFPLEIPDEEYRSKDQGWTLPNNFESFFYTYGYAHCTL